MGITRSSLLIWLITMQHKPIVGMDNKSQLVQSGSAQQTQVIFPNLYSETYIKELKQAVKDAIQRGRQESAQLIQFYEQQRENTKQLYETQLEISKHLKEQLDKVRGENLKLQQKMDELQELLKIALEGDSTKNIPTKSKLQELLALFKSSV